MIFSEGYMGGEKNEKRVPLRGNNRHCNSGCSCFRILLDNGDTEELGTAPADCVGAGRPLRGCS